MTRAAWITGITGQDGSYLAELLLSKGYWVWGLYRHASGPHQLSRIETLRAHPNLTLLKGDLLDETSMRRVVTALEESGADRVEVYHLAAQSFVELSFQMPENTMDTNCRGTTKLLEVLRHSKIRDTVRIYHAATSEMFGKVHETPQREDTPFHPRSPYGVSKVYAYWLCRNYRESYGMFIANGILFNHESPRRGENFVTRKITLGVARVTNGGAPIELGNMDARRDWGHAKDYVEGMWKILQHSHADDWVLSSQETHSIREFVEEAFACCNVKVAWKGTGLEEVGVNAETGQVLVKVNPAFFRPAEVDLLLGDSTRARERLGWTPRHTFQELVQDMVLHDVLAFKQQSRQE